jgi:type I restriction-modification system DNA methylase subunit
MPISGSPLFNRKMLNAALERFDIAQVANIEQKRQILAKWKQAIESQKLKQAGEVPLHGEFLIDIFAAALGYTRITEDQTEWHLKQEQKMLTNATKADGALGFFTTDHEDVRAVIELKSANTDLDAKQRRKHDQRSPVEQAFSYVPKSGKQCNWIIVSNYVELRLYHKNSLGEYESFRIADLTDEAEFKRFYYLLSIENLIAKDGESVIDALYRKSEEEEKSISKRFYAEYTQARLHLFEHLKQQNPPLTPPRRGIVPQMSPLASSSGEISVDDYHQIPLLGGVRGGYQHDLFLLEKTQKLLDRFIFVCFCEDTGMLPERIFRKVVKHAQESLAFTEDKIWTELKGLFRAIDQGLPAHGIHGFDGELFKPDPNLDALHIRDDVFDELVKITDYDFASDLNVNILGHIFEQSISDLEELRAGIEGKKSDRKQGKRKKEGIFYTPEYITRYIVENAVGGWLEDRKQEFGCSDLPELIDEDYASVKVVKSVYKGNKKIEQHRAFWEAYKAKLMNIKVLDPACGSGAFLNQAFDFLHKEGQRVNDALAALSHGQKTIFDLDKHILSNNLYGVDLNPESVEITKLSLWLKTANKHSQLTTLDDNIITGNSLIDDPAVAGEKAFKWEQEFPEIMRNGGFDVVIGNPPYVRQEVLGSYKLYFEQCYQTYHGIADLYVYFIERGISLLKPNGFFSFIVSNKWMRANYGRPLRTWLQQYQIQGIIDFGELPVFEDAATFPCILTISKTAPVSVFKVVKVKTLEFGDLEEYYQTHCYAVIQSLLQEESWALVEEGQQKLLDKLKGLGVPLDKYVQRKVYFGIKTGLNEVFVIGEEIRKQLVTEDPKSVELIKPFVVGDDVRKYHINFRQRYLILCPKGWTRQQSNNAEDAWGWFQEHYPAVAKYLFPFAEAAQKRYDKGEFWWELRECNYYHEFENPKIVYPDIAKESRFAFDDSGLYSANTTYFIPSSDLYLLALLNSRLIFAYFKRIAAVLGDEDKGGRLRWFRQDVLKLPIHPINFSNPTEKAWHDAIVAHVTTILDLHKQRQAIQAQFLKLLANEFALPKLTTKLENWPDLDWKTFENELEKAKVTLSLKQKAEWMDYFEEQKAKVSTSQQTIDQTDKEIDRMVYELYGLTEEEIRIVEGGTS